MFRTGFLCLIVVFGVSAMAAGQRARFEQTDIFFGGEFGYKEFRIPVLVVTNEGALLVFTEAGITSSDYGDRDILVRRSTDGGRNWGDLQLLIDRGTSRVGSPAVIVDRESGRINLLVAVDSKQALQIYSDDGGRTWSDFKDITYVYDAYKSQWPWTRFDTGPGKGIELERGKYKGRFVMQGWLSIEDKQYRSLVIYSDDRGQTWQPGGMITEQHLNSNENSVVEGVDGTLWMHIRGGDSRPESEREPYRLVASSSDGGLTWSKTHRNKDLITPRCLASTWRYSWPEEDRGRILFANPADKQHRINMTAYVSYDDGGTWPVSRQIFDGPSSYSSLARFPDGSIGLAYERGERYRYEKMTFARFTLEWLTEGKDSLKAKSACDADVPAELTTPNYRVTRLKGVGHEKDVRRQDPSNVIKYGDSYHIWYSKVVREPDEPFSAYYGTIWHASSTDGINWIEHGRSVGPGRKGAWDSRGVLTPYVAVLGGHLFMFYTGTGGKEPFETNSTLRHIGMAMTDDPSRGWRKLESNPLLSPGKDKSGWDGLLVDDAHVIVRDGKFWFYYKGRNGVTGSDETKWGLAISDYVTGPYVKYEKNPIIDSGHTVCVWPHREGVAALVDFAGPQKHTVQYEADGIHFRQCAKVEPRVLTGCGPYDPDAFGDVKYGRGIRWGVAQDGRGEIYIARFDCDLEAPGPK